MGVKVKIGSSCILEYCRRRYHGTILDIRGSTKMFLVSFTDRSGRTKHVWRNAKELSPASPYQEDAEPTVVEVLPGPEQVFKEAKKS